MQIVINVSEEIMEYVKNNGCLSVIYNDEVAKAITDGTPLPKGHGDLIDRDKFKSLMGEYFIDTSKLHYEDLTNAKHFNWGIENCFNEIDEMESVIEADKRGEE